jgi:pimeloyl-ACP methyl ester carboxylesterase
MLSVRACEERHSRRIKIQLTREIAMTQSELSFLTERPIERASAVPASWSCPQPQSPAGHHSIPPALCRHSLLLESSDGAAIRIYELDGDEDAPPIVFGHGCGFAAGTYLPFLAGFTGLKVFAFDARGHGGSTCPDRELPDSFTVKQMSIDLELVGRFVIGRTGRRAHYVGHSMGASTALWMLGFDGAPLFSGFTLFEPAVFPGLGDPTHAEATTKHHRLRAACGRRRTYWDSREQYATALSARGPFALWSAEMMRAHVHATTQQAVDGRFELCCGPRVEDAILADLMAPALWHVLPTIDRPVHLVSADPSREDREWVTTCIDAVARRLPNATLDTLTGTHHISMFSHLSECRALVESHCAMATTLHTTTFPGAKRRSLLRLDKQ